MLLELPQIAQAVVDTYEPEPGTVELVAYYALKQGAAELPRGEIARDAAQAACRPTWCRPISSSSPSSR